ncbi:DUF5050 domain-containing protein [Paenibacillus whitsoniae]|uniref:DUF5050 domain-containing protein n=1 Tax=Paenibacillus whitsoniae TaxID=2496558 RepID=A0A3S0ASH1_9BACL|nr:DUF5050 domain-containing protein [Paenibacillus whitsoniae]RTE11558.1 DUF5050 domain-containing protein [Paenibacillus whitsoniae]
MNRKGAGWMMSGLLLLILGAPGQAQALTNDVEVTIPNYPVHLNGHLVDNKNREYPLLVYKEITYVPMTWYDARLLGLESSWSADGGLQIAQKIVASSYVGYRSEQMNAAVYHAQVSEGPISVNGQSIDNPKEPYPLLSFRDVTYFPLTWRFAHDAFHWDYAWDAVEGLSIQSSNAQVMDVSSLPSDNDRALYQGYYYFVETEGSTNEVYRTPTAGSDSKELLYTYDIDSGHGLQKNVTFQLREDVLWLRYHVGGATMGHDVYVRIAPDGKATVSHQGYLDFRETDDGTVIANQGNPPSAGNLSLVPEGKDRASARQLGEPGMMYGRHVTADSNMVSVGGDGGSMRVIGDDVYVIGSAYPPTTGALNHIFRIHLKDGKSVPLVNASVGQFRIFGSSLYYIKDEDASLYRAELDGTNESRLTDKPVAWFGVMGENVFYTSSGSGVADPEKPSSLYLKNGDHPEGILLLDAVKSAQIAGDRLVCVMGDDSPYGMELLDDSGSIVLKIANGIERVLASDEGLLIAAKGEAGALTTLFVK